MSKVCVFIGEGLSDKLFIQALLTCRLGFRPLGKKDPHLFQKGPDRYWHCPFPPSSTCPIGGKGRLIKTETYRIADGIIQSEAHLMDDADDTHYRILTDHTHADKEGQRRRSDAIEQAFGNSGVIASSFKAQFVENEIECWYFAGIPENAPFLNTREAAYARRLLRMDPERIPDPKSCLKRILLPDAHGSIKMASEVGRHFDLDKAQNKSASFRTFLKGLEADRLV